MKKSIIYILLVLVLLSGCTKPVTPESEPVTIVEPTELEVSNEPLTREEQFEILQNYYQMLNERNNEEEIVNYLNENINKLDTKETADILLELEEYLRSNNLNLTEVVNILMKYYEITTHEIKSYLDILNMESKNIYTDGENINIELEELLQRAIVTENHVGKFPIGKTNKRVMELYTAYIEGAILGAGNQYIYAEDSSSSIKLEAIDVYKDIIEKNKDSNTAKILSNYLEVLTMDNNDMNGENVLKFYENLYNIIIENTK